MHLREITTVGAASVDRDRGIIPGVKILGRVSKNGREYSDKALKEAAAKYEGVEVNVNHPDRSKPNVERRIEDGFGWLEAVQVRADGVYGNLHYLKEHPSAGLVAEAAERNPNRFGLSHNAVGSVAKRNGKNVVESIDRVISVDLVQNPATNQGLFESEFRTIRETLERTAPEVLKRLTEDGALLPPEAMDEPISEPIGDPATPEHDNKASAKAALVQLLAALVELPGDIKQICVQLIDVAQKIIAGQPGASDPHDPADQNADPNADPDADPTEGDPAQPGSRPGDDPEAAAEPSAEQDDAEQSANPFAKRKNPMAESTVPTTPKSVEQRLALLEAENKEYRERLELQALRERCEEMLRKSNREVTVPRLNALANMASDEDRQALIEEMQPLEDPNPAPRKFRPSFSAPAEPKRTAAYPESLTQFVEACR